MGSCFSRRRQSEPDYSVPEKGQQISGSIKTPISVLAPLKVCKESKVGFAETVHKIQSKRETRGRRASVKEQSEHLSESEKGAPTSLQALQATVQESVTICAGKGDPLLDASNMAKKPFVSSIESLKQTLVAQKQESEIAYCDEVSASLDAQSPSETVGELSRKRELTRILDSITVKLDSSLHASAAEATSNVMDDVNVSMLGNSMEANSKPEVVHDSHKIDELKGFLCCDVRAPVNLKVGNERQEFSKTPETELKVTDMTLDRIIADPKMVDQQLLGGGKQHLDKVQKTDESSNYSNEVGVTSQSTWQQLDTRNTTNCDLGGKLDVVHQRFIEDGRLDLDHITILPHGRVVKDERYKEFVKPNERFFPHELNENEPLHVNEGMCTTREDGFVAYRPNKNCKQRMSRGLDELQLFPQERFMSSASHHFIILENLPSHPNSNSGQGREGMENRATSEAEICLGRSSPASQMNFLCESQKGETSESDSETFEFQHTMDYYQENSERTEQEQETVVVEQANKRASSERKRGWGVFQYEENSVKRGKTAAKSELACEDSRVIDDLALSRDHEKHSLSKGMLQMHQQRTREEEDTDGSGERGDLFASGTTSEHALILAGSNTEELHFVPCGSFVPDTPPISSIQHLAANTSLANTSLRFDPYHRQQEASALSLQNIISLLEKDELDEEDLLSMLINAKSTCQTSDVASESSFEFKIKSAGSTPHSTPSTPMLSAGSTPRRINQINPMVLTPEEIAEIWGVFEARQTLASH